MATVTGKLNAVNNTYDLDDLESGVLEKRPSKRQRKEASPKMTKASKDKFPDQYLIGKLNVSNLLQTLNGRGIATSKVEEPGPGSFIIHLEKDEALIRIDDNETHVVCEEVKGSNTREVIKQCIVSCLSAF